MRTPGECFFAAMRAADVECTAHAGEDWQDVPSARRAEYERAAASYDAAVRTMLPDDIEAFLADVAKAPLPRRDVPLLVAIIRAQGAELASVKRAHEARGETVQRLMADFVAAVEERDAIHARLGKVERAARDALYHLEGCTISHPDGCSVAVLMLGGLREILQEGADGTTQAK